MIPAIEARHLRKTYDSGRLTVHALHSASLALHAGEVLLLMGPSGSGKTTLLSILGCILRPTAGSLRITGTDVTSLHERDLPMIRREHIGFIFQGFNLFPALSAGENVRLALQMKGMPAAESMKRAQELLAPVGLEDKYHELPANLSGGQKQRVAIARALAGDPSIILADEPTAALDGETAQAVMRLLRGLAVEKKRAVAIVTHDARLQAYADRVVHLEDGRIQEN